MAALSSIAEVRTLGRLPDAIKLPDMFIQPHLDAANRELIRWIGDYSGVTGSQIAQCKEAEGCLCIAYLLPVMNTFFTQGAITIQKEIGDMDFLFHSPDDLEKLIEYWMNRAKKATADMVEDRGVSGIIGWYAI
jgi:hypothetical protein